MEKLDFKKAYKNYYSAKQIPELHSFGEVNCLTITGKGEPGGKEFQAANEVLFPMAYGVKKICKLKGMDFGVPALEGFWWTDNNTSAQDTPRSDWNWKLMIRMPDYATSEMYQTALAEVLIKKKNPLARNVLFEKIDEGKAAQILHIGAYTDEQPTIDALYQFIESNGMSLNGLHHEIYLSDPRKTKPADLKTIIRQGVK
ncbi:MAG: GyrI-like domain-containing protein [Cyclobacteriaceae bacterium]|nr:GyrI-like domain-containing protein [Cyclobacteriaceae bacterium]